MVEAELLQARAAAESEAPEFVDLRHAPAVARQPHRWMPWNYTEALTNEP